MHGDHVLIPRRLLPLRDVILTHSLWQGHGESDRQVKYGVSPACSKLRLMLTPMAISKDTATANLYSPNMGTADVCVLHTAAVLEPSPLRAVSRISRYLFDSK